MSTDDSAAPATAAATIQLPWWVKEFVLPELKPEVDTLTADLKAQEPQIVSIIDGKIGQGESVVGAAVDTIIENIKPGGVFGLFWGQVEPKLEAALTAELQKLGGDVNAQQLFDAGYAKLTAFEAAVGL